MQQYQILALQQTRSQVYTMMLMNINVHFLKKAT